MQPVFATLVVVAFFLINRPSQKIQPDSGTPVKTQDSGQLSGSQNTDSVQGKIDIKPDIDYQKLQQNQDLQDLMGERKESLGIKKSLDECAGY